MCLLPTGALWPDSLMQELFRKSPSATSLLTRHSGGVCGSAQAPVLCSSHSRLSQSVCTAITRYHMSGLNKRNLLFTLLEAGKFVVKVMADQVPGEEPLPGYVLVCWRERNQVLPVSSYKDTNLNMKAPPL